MLETIVYRKIIDFLQPLISKSKFGFLRRRLCLSQLLDSFNYIFEAVENNSSVEAVYLDFRKTFDTVPHQELLYKLWLSGITGPLWRWFQCYLSNHQNFTSIDGVASARLPGVPQGCILGPLSFILYTNDLPSNLQSPVCMFADDTKLLRVITSFNDNVELQSDLDSISEWCNLWKLNLNESKCSSLFFSLRSSTGPSFIIKDYRVNKASTHRDLGIMSLLTCSDPITFLKCVHQHIILSTLSERMSLPNLHLLL